MSSWLPSSPLSCFCQRSWISYPHWPPSTYQEVLEQLECVLRKNSDHRKYLASCWLSFVNRKAFWDPSQISVGSRYLRSHRVVMSGIPWGTEERGARRPAQTSTDRLSQSVLLFAFCDPVLQERRFDCLCHCGSYRPWQSVTMRMWVTSSWPSRPHLTRFWLQPGWKACCRSSPRLWTIQRRDMSRVELKLPIIHDYQRAWEQHYLFFVFWQAMSMSTHSTSSFFIFFFFSKNITNHCCCPLRPWLGSVGCAWIPLLTGR
jgi:hypothetical protein